MNSESSIEEEACFYGDQAIVSDKIIMAHRKKIYSKIKKGMCHTSYTICVFIMHSWLGVTPLTCKQLTTVSL